MIIGIDIGYGYTKAVMERRTVRMPSVVGPSVYVRYTENGRGHSLTMSGGESWFWGEWAQLQSPFTLSPKSRERTGASIIGVLFNAAMIELGITGGEVKVVTGLPVEWFDDRHILERQLKTTHHFLLDNLLDNGKQYAITVSDLVVIPQPVGSLFYTIMDEEGKLINADLAKGRIGLVDIGMYTTDYCLIDKMRYVDRGSGSVDVGMGRVYELLGRELQEAFGLRTNTHDLDQSVREGKITLNGDKMALVDMLRPIMQTVGDRITSKTSELWGNARDLDRIILTGGGAIPMRSFFSSVYPHLMSLPDPDMANARGFYRRGLRLWSNSIASVLPL